MREAHPHGEKKNFCRIFLVYGFRRHLSRLFVEPYAAILVHQGYWAILRHLVLKY
ncbi:hypothetical protein DSUL_90091 [Desulfovibrionales bacterium]